MRVVGTLLMVLLAATARADEPAIPAADSIAAAKKDLAQIKSPVSQQVEGTIPSLDMKDLGQVPATQRPEFSPALNADKDPSLDPAKKKAGTGNWLVDAMDKNTSTQASRSKEKDDVLKGDPDLIRADEKGLRLEKDPFAADEARETEKPKEAAGAVYNPLDSFMSGWISARDHDLLLTPPKGDGLAAADGGRTRSDLLPGLEVGSPGPSTDFTLAPIDSAAFGDSRAASNPYVALMDLPSISSLRAFVAPDAPQFAPAEIQDLPRGLSPSGLDVRPIDTPRTFVPDFALPDDDDKYFKQLKKF
jgi:hypothetical protein